MSTVSKTCIPVREIISYTREPVAIGSTVMATLVNTRTSTFEFRMTPQEHEEFEERVEYYHSSWHETRVKVL